VYASAGIRASRIIGRVSATTHTAPTTSTSRLDRAVTAMEAAGVRALLIGPGADLRHLIGYDTHPLERMTLLVAAADGNHLLVVPELERARAEAAGVGVPVHGFGETDDPFALVAAHLDGGRADEPIGVGDQLWARFVLGLQDAMPGATWTPASAVTRQVRMAKAPEEVAGLRAAGRAIDAVHAQVPGLLRPGRTEDEVGRDIAEAMLAAGHDAIDFVIVGSGPNGASPHHETSDRVIQAGDAVVVDIGGPVDGWFSDCTRCYVVGEEPEGYAEAYAVLKAAQQAAVDHVRPGVTAESVDRAARQVITDAGYGDAFIHRTGHGIGLEVHEEPYLVEGNDLVLTEGMTFSIEPGIYLEGRFGMRLEDIVAVTADGVERLNAADHDRVMVPVNP
jgi:Xaa-Pro aminopeptidase